MQSKKDLTNKIKKSFNRLYTVLVRLSRKPQNPHMQSSTHMSDVVQAVAFVTAANTTALVDRALAAIREAIVSPAQPQSARAPVSVCNDRDPALAEFEAYLISNLRASDVCEDGEGVRMFNINQVAYLVEECKTKDQQNATRKKLKEHMLNIRLQMRLCPRSGNSECMTGHLHDIYTHCC